MIKKMIINLKKITIKEKDREFIPILSLITKKKITIMKKEK